MSPHYFNENISSVSMFFYDYCTFIKLIFLCSFSLLQLQFVTVVTVTVITVTVTLIQFLIVTDLINMPCCMVFHVTRVQ